MNALTHTSAQPLPAPLGAAGATGPRRISSRATRWLIGGVLAVLCAVTLTRLQLFAIYANERDAVRLLGQLGEGLVAFEGRAGHRPGNLGEALSGPLSEPSGKSGASLPRGASEAEWLVEGTLLRWHGYLFDLASGPGGEALLRAWPWLRGRTGFSAFAFSPQLGLLGHANGGRRAVPLEHEVSAVEGGLEPPWSGLLRRPQVSPQEDWRRLPAGATGPPR